MSLANTASNHTMSDRKLSITASGILLPLSNRYECHDLNHDDPEQVLYSLATNYDIDDDVLWEKGIKQELDVLHSNNTWTMVPIIIG